MRQCRTPIQVNVSVISQQAVVKLSLLACIKEPVDTSTLVIKASHLYFLVLVPVRDDGNMSDVPAHPRDPKGNNLEWLKKL